MTDWTDFEIGTMATALIEHPNNMAVAALDTAETIIRARRVQSHRRIDAALALHEPIDLESRSGVTSCKHDGRQWPCATVRALS